VKWYTQPHLLSLSPFDPIIECIIINHSLFHHLTTKTSNSFLFPQKPTWLIYLRKHLPTFIYFLHICYIYESSFTHHLTQSYVFTCHFFYPQFITYLHFVLYPSLFANESSFIPGYHIFQKHIHPPNTSSPNEYPSTSGYHFTKCFIYPPKSIIDTFTRIFNPIILPTTHHLPTFCTFTFIVC